MINIVPPSAEQTVLPLTLAFLASCDPPGRDPEALFEGAENRAPTNDTIVLLHARYLWKKDPTKSLPIWQKLKRISKNPTLQSLADDYLSGRGEEKAEAPTKELWNYFFSFLLGGGYETNPTYSPPSSVGPSSPTTNLQFGIYSERRLPFGLLTISDYTAYTDYFQAHSADIFEESLEVPLYVTIASNQYLGIRPFGSYLYQGGTSYYTLAGAGIPHLIYFSHFRQTLQISAYRDFFFDPTVQMQGGVHFRGEYKGDLYPAILGLRTFIAFYERVSAGIDTSSPNVISVPYSHNDIGGELFFGVINSSWFLFDLNPRALYRMDTDNSVSGTPGSPPTSTKLRADLELDVQANMIFILTPTLHLGLRYEYFQNNSNIGSLDYQDRNATNHTVSLGLKFNLTNF